MAADPALDLHVVVTDGGNNLLHTIRRENAGWLPLGNVQAQAGATGPVRSIATVADGESLHVFVVATTVLHTIRAANGTWTP